MTRNSNKKFSMLEKVELMMKVIRNEDCEQIISKFTVFQLKELRDFLENELLFLASFNNNSLNINKIKSGYPSIHDYYYAYDCREDLDSCYNESCFASNPNCFSRKMREQIDILLSQLKKYLIKNEELEFEFEHH
jgi:hypothetical protein